MSKKAGAVFHWGTIWVTRSAVYRLRDGEIFTGTSDLGSVVFDFTIMYEPHKVHTLRGRPGSMQV